MLQPWIKHITDDTSTCLTNDTFLTDTHVFVSAVTSHITLVFGVQHANPIT